MAQKQHWTKAVEAEMKLHETFGRSNIRHETSADGDTIEIHTDPDGYLFLMAAHHTRWPDR